MTVAMFRLFYLAVVPTLVSGAIVDVTWLVSRQTFNEVSVTSSIGALSLAVNRASFSNSTYRIQWTDPSCDAKDSVIAMYQTLIEKRYRPEVLFGPPCSDAMTFVGQLAGYRNLPTFGWISGNTAFRDRSIYNTLVRLFPPDNSYSEGVMMVLKRFDWHRVFIISSKTARYADVAAYIDSELLSDSSYTIADWVTVNDNDVSSISSTLTMVQQQARIVLMIMPLTSLRQWMAAAYTANMATGSYAFIYVSIDMPTATAYSKLTSESLWQQGQTDDSNVKQAMQSLLILTTQPIDGAAIGQFKSNAWQAGQNSQLASTLNVTATQPDDYAAYLYDAFLLYDLLSRDAIRAGKSQSDGEYMLQNAVGRKFTSADASFATGNVIIDENGDRQPNFWLLNLGTGGAFVSAVTFTFDVTSDRRLSDKTTAIADIIWGNGKIGDDNKPSDNPACGFSNEKCPNLGLYIGVPLAASAVIVIALVVFFAIRRRQFEQNLSSMAWKLDEAQLKFPMVGGLTQENLMKSSLTSVQRMALLNRRRSSVYSGSAIHSQATGSGAGGGHGDDSVSVGQTSHLSFGMTGGQIFIETAVYQNGVVAIKRLPAKRLNISRSLMVEMLHMTHMKHRNVASFIGATTEPPTIFEVWEHCPKGSIQDIIFDDRITLDNMFKFSIIIDVLKGLKYIHESQIKQHGKLKSSNVVVDGRWTCKLTDYGLAALHDALDGGDVDATDGSPSSSRDKRYQQLQWTAPELLRVMQQEGRRVSTMSTVGGGMKKRPTAATMSPEGDVYAAAVILKEVFARNGPYTEYEDMEPREIIERIRDYPADKSVALMRPTLPDMNDRNLEKMLGIMRAGWCERPQDRPTVQQMLKDVQRINPFKSTNVVDNMIQLMERYSNHLEDMVEEKTIQVADEKRKSETLLYRMLPVPVAEKLKVGESVDAEAFDAVTIYFSDIVKFTVLSAESTPLQVVTLLNALYTVFDSTIARHDVYKVETIGDAYMLVSGLPVRNGDRHAVEIANCAMELLSGIQNFKVPHKPDYKLQIRIGLHTGPVVAGVVGLTMPRYCLFGATVGRASSMESGGLPMRIHISEQMYKILSKFPGYHLALRGQVHELPGIGLIKSYWLYNRDGYTRPLPDFQQEIVHDDPQPEILPVTCDDLVEPTQKRTGVNFVSPSDVSKDVIDETLSGTMTANNYHAKEIVKQQVWSETAADCGEKLDSEVREGKHKRRHRHRKNADKHNSEDGERGHKKKHRHRHRSASAEERSNIVENEANDEGGERKHRKRHHRHHRHRSVPADGEISEQTTQLQPVESGEDGVQRHGRRHRRHRHHHRNRSVGDVVNETTPLSDKDKGQGRLLDLRDEGNSYSHRKVNVQNEQNNNSPLFISSNVNLEEFSEVSNNSSKTERENGNSKVNVTDDEPPMFTRRLSRCRVAPAPDIVTDVAAPNVSTSDTHRTVIEALD